MHPYAPCMIYVFDQGRSGRRQSQAMSQPGSLTQDLLSAGSLKKHSVDASEEGQSSMPELTAKGADVTSTSHADNGPPAMESMRSDFMTQSSPVASPTIEEASSLFTSHVVEMHPSPKTEVQAEGDGGVGTIEPPDISEGIAQLNLGITNEFDDIVQSYTEEGDPLESQEEPPKGDQQHGTSPPYADIDMNGNGEGKSLLLGTSFAPKSAQGLQDDVNREIAAKVFLVDDGVDGDFDIGQGRGEAPLKDSPGDQDPRDCSVLLAENVEATSTFLEAQQLPSSADFASEHGKEADEPPYILDFGNDEFFEEITASQDASDELLGFETSYPPVEQMLSPSRAVQVFDHEDGLWEALLEQDQPDTEPAFDEALSVPEGWYGENGEWNWYTAEERELVRQSMGLTPAVTPSTESRQTTEEFKLPSMTAQSEMQALSESDARRTPSIQEYSISTVEDEWNALGRYAVPPRFNDEVNQQVNPYEPRKQSTTQPILSRTAQPVQSWVPQASPSTATQGTGLTPRGITKDFRGGSSAYDPPILRPQKSFVRAAALPCAPVAPFSSPPFLPPPPHTTVSSPQNQTAPLLSRELPSPLHPGTHRYSAQEPETYSQTEGYLLGASPQTLGLDSRTKNPERAEESNYASAYLQRDTADAQLTEERGGSSSYSYQGGPMNQPLEDRRANSWDDEARDDVFGAPVEEQALGGRDAVPWSKLQHGQPKSLANEAIDVDFPHVESVPFSSTPPAPVGGCLPPSPKPVIRSPALHSARQSDILQSVKSTLAYQPQALTEELGVDADPLARQGLSARRAPIIAFGFRGVLAMSFPAAETDLSEDASLVSSSHGYGYGSPRAQIRLETVDKVVPLSALMLSDVIFPGPLTGEGLTTRPSDKTVKQRRDAVLHYLIERIDELERGLPFLSSGLAGGPQREEFGRLVVLRILRIMLKHNGSIRGSPEIDDELRDAFVLPSPSPSSLFKPRSPSGGFPQLNLEVQDTARIFGYVEPLLKLGKRQEALEAAIQHQAWAHALLIASSLGEEQWRRATALFSASLFNDASVATESLKMTYAIFGGRTNEAVEELCNSSHQRNASLNQWNQVVAAILEHGKPADQEQLTRLGRCLSSLGMATAGHACFLVSPEYTRQSEVPVMNDFTSGDLQTDFDDFVILEEIAEFASSLKHAASKPREPFTGQKYLWPYKLRRAWGMADRGDTVGAQRYCKALLSNSQSTMPSILVDNLRDLTDRLAGDISATGIGAGASQKGLKPGMDKLGSWFEGRITKFIAGDDDFTGGDPNPLANLNSASATVGPFTHWSAIGHSDDVHPPANDLFSTGGTGDNIPSTLVAAARLAYMPEVTASTSVSPEGSPPTRYAPVNEGYGSSALSSTAIDDNHEDDLGLGNSSNSTRRRTPASPSGGVEKVEPDKAQAKATKMEADPPSNSVTKASWLGRLWGKKEGESTGPVRAKLGEESSMVFDPELKRWIVKGTKPEAITPSLAPPPRAQTVSPAASSVPRSNVPIQRAAVTNPPSMSSTPAPNIAQTAAPSAPTKRLQSIIQDEALPKPPTNRASQGAGSLDDLLTRPPSKRPGSAAAKKNIRNRYVDVLQPTS